jgi:hypothetical protein
MAGDEIRTAAEIEENHALPAAHAMLADPSAPRTVEQKPLPEYLSRKPVAEKSAAEWAYERLLLYVKAFEEGLDNTQEVAVGFTGGVAGVMRIEGLGYFAPDIVTFYGTDEGGNRTQLIQHVSQLGVTLRAVPKAPSHAEPRRIGFRIAADLEGG